MLLVLGEEGGVCGMERGNVEYVGLGWDLPVDSQGSWMGKDYASGGIMYSCRYEVTSG